ncbi:MAG: hypothetical protein K8J08_16840 [Thermoanaerobaculia bacterium]|nr:hypothetical protein [Thermoanaerobaculia bacterium]
MSRRGTEDPARLIGDRWRSSYRPKAPIGDCCDDEALVRGVLGEMALDERTRLADHLVTCRECAVRYRLAAELHAIVEVSDRPTAAPVRAIRWGAVAALALALLAVAFAVRLWIPDSATLEPRSVDVVRGPSSAILMPPDGAVLRVAPETLVWPAPSVGDYRVRLFDHQAEPIWETIVEVGGEEENGTVDLPAAVRGRLQSGAAYFWVIDGLGGAAGLRHGPSWFELQEE